MERSTGRRTADLALIALTVVALVVGGWWWFRQAPAAGRDGTLPRPGTEYAGQFPAGIEVRLNPATGEVVGVRTRSDRDWTTTAVPVHRDAMLREAVTLADGNIRSWTVRAGGQQRLLVQYSCVGLRGLSVRLMVAGRVLRPLIGTARCDGSYRSEYVIGTGGPVVVSVVSRRTSGGRFLVQVVGTP